MANAQLLTLSDLANELPKAGVKISRRTVYRRAADGTIPTFKMGRVSIVSRSDLPAIAASLSAPVRRVRA